MYSVVSTHTYICACIYIHILTYIYTVNVPLYTQIHVCCPYILMCMYISTYRYLLLHSTIYFTNQSLFSTSTWRKWMRTFIDSNHLLLQCYCNLTLYTGTDTSDAHRNHKNSALFTLLIEFLVWLFQSQHPLQSFCFSPPFWQQFRWCDARRDESNVWKTTKLIL